MFSSYCYILKKVNPGTVTRIEVDRENRFKYLLLAFGAAIKDFQYMKKVIGIDGTFLKGPYKGVLLVTRHKMAIISIILSHWASLIQTMKMLGLGS